MDNYRNSAAEAQPERYDPVSVAASLRDDFNGLIAIFDRHLSRPLDVDGEVRLALSEAKCAAQRGHDLSKRLMGLLRQSI